ncbi:MAG: zinc dependent phospholipase C family protein [Clostridia bacterium]|nr:zinc dependent phospholipase C family protein [Clostridia bacterium]
MKRKDHKALAYYLMNCAEQGPLWKRTWHRRFFVWGCICPDYVPFTYLRGFRQSHAMLGHHARYSGAYIQKMIQRLQRRGVKKRRDCFALGKLMHYLADSFTFPHTNGFTGTMREHRRYEKELHERFEKQLFSVQMTERQTAFRGRLLTDHLQRIREEYDRAGGGYEPDCEQILCSCAEVFLSLCEI